jgi:sec-independent protein translocase protein TatA
MKSLVTTEVTMIGTAELILILCVILVLFGGKKLPDLARNLGRGMREFKKAFYGIEDDVITVEAVQKEKEESPPSNNPS